MVGEEEEEEVDGDEEMEEVAEGVEGGERAEVIEDNQMTDQARIRMAMEVEVGAEVVDVKLLCGALEELLLPLWYNEE